MDALKDMFNEGYYRELASAFSKADKNFKTSDFLKTVNAGIEDLSLNQRMRHTSVTLRSFLPEDYKKAIGTMKQVIPNTRRGYTNLVFPDFVGLYGHDHPELSLEALKYFTQFGSSEFAIREFLKRDFESTITQMKIWSKDKNEHVRRLASEGSRPRLPWSFKLDKVIKDPSLTKDILNQLKEDDSLYVRKSVANHLNDISKEHPGYMISLVNSWNKAHPHTSWIIKHASRTLIKKGDPASLKVFNYEKNIKLKLEKFKLNKTEIKLGESLDFSFDLVSEKKTEQKLVVDYIIHYKKKSGELSPKVFKLKDLNLGAAERLSIRKKQLIKDFTTRKHFAGDHVLEIQVNGIVLGKKNFKLIL